MEKHILSKSTYIRSLQCLKALYLCKYHYKLRDPVSEELKIRFDKGHDIGKLAQRLFPGGIDASPDHVYNYHKSVALTQELISKGYGTIYEAAFQFEQVLAVADILVKKSGNWYAYEVKSSPVISDTYLKDVALQYHVIANGGFPDKCGTGQIADFSILYLNQKLNDALINEPSKIFSEQSVLEYCRSQSEYVSKNIFSAKEIITKKVMPSIEIGDHCLKPYKCDFFGFCHRTEPELGKLF